MFLNAQHEAFAEEQPQQDADSAVAQPADDATTEPKKDEEEELPPIEIDYILVGGGATSFSALRELLAQDGDSKVLFPFEKLLKCCNLTNSFDNICEIQRSCW